MRADELAGHAAGVGVGRVQGLEGVHALGFMGIPAVIERTLELLPAERVHSFQSLYAADADARRVAGDLVDARAGARRSRGR